MTYNVNLDKKDYEILRELDINFRESFSKIGKKVKLSKNSISLRYEKLKEYMLHNTIGINNEILGYTRIKVYYSFDFIDENLEKEIAKELIKHNHILWASRLYGPYDLEICLFVRNLDELISEVTSFNNKFSKKINQKETQIIFKQIFFRNNYLHEKSIPKKYIISRTIKKINLSKKDKEILLELWKNPRISLTDISNKTSLNVRTVKNRIKFLEKNGIIMGYFIKLNPSKFDYTPFKILIKTQNIKDEEEFESYISSIKNVSYITKNLGLWDYEIDFVFKNINELQNNIEQIKKEFPNSIKRIEYASAGKRLITNNKSFFSSN